MSDTPNWPQEAIRLGGLIVERKTDVLALTAFVLSVIGIAAQVREYVRGSQLVFWGPDQVLIMYDETHDTERKGDRTFVRFGGRMTYVNDGAAAYSDIIRDETVEISVGGRTLIQRAQHILEYVDTNEDGVDEVLARNPVLPTAIRGGETMSREVVFASRRAGGEEVSRNYLTKKDWIELSKGEEPIRLRFMAESYQGQKLFHECEVRLDGGYRDALALRGHVAPTCWPRERTSCFLF